MKKLRKRLSAVLHALGVTNTSLTGARNNWLRLHDAANKAETRQHKAQKRADNLRKTRPTKAARQDKRAVRFGQKKQRVAAKAQTEVAHVKRLTRKAKGISNNVEDIRAEIRKLKGDVKIAGNKATGGTDRERLFKVALQAAANCASGSRPNFYSQYGAWDVDHCITGEAHGHRSDCSSWVTSAYKSCGLADPNGTSYTGGYTGTLVTHGTRFYDESKLQPGDLIIYGSGAGHHVEMYVGPGNRTVGHGSAPVDFGIVHLLPGPITFVSYL